MLHGSNGYSPLSEVRGLVHDSIAMTLVPGPIGPVSMSSTTFRKKETHEAGEPITGGQKNSQRTPR